MALNKQHKALAVVAALGISAVALDRLVLSSPGSGPASASASVSTTAVGPALATDGPAPIPTGTGIAPVPDAPDPTVQRFTGHADLADRLGDMADVKGLDLSATLDAFAPRGDFGRAPTQADQPATGPAFDQRHRLEATFSTDGRGVAVVGGTTLRVGSVFDGYTLIRIEEGAAHFERDGVKMTLKLLSG